MARAIKGRGIMAARVNFQLIKNPIVNKIKSIYILESARVKIPNPAVNYYLPGRGELHQQY
jgi:hypothetical protein